MGRGLRRALRGGIRGLGRCDFHGGGSVEDMLGIGPPGLLRCIVDYAGICDVCAG